MYYLGIEMEGRRMVQSELRGRTELDRQRSKRSHEDTTNLLAQHQRRISANIVIPGFLLANRNIVSTYTVAPPQRASLKPTQSCIICLYCTTFDSIHPDHDKGHSLSRFTPRSPFCGLLCVFLILSLSPLPSIGR